MIYIKTHIIKLVWVLIYRNAGSYRKGFDWDRTPEGLVFWGIILIWDSISHFYTLYPKQNYPKVMMVSMYPITEPIHKD